ncbi:hypothetical protein FRC20_004818 [Serendipita sp. 405]|nr:hypothetical protein FRC20_004818 [Serendipita sp. 405]
MSSPERPGPQFNTNQVPSHFLLKYLWSELRSRQVEREQHLSKKTTYENEVTSYADVVRKEEPALIAAQKAVEYHSATIDYIRSRPTAPFPDVANDLSSSTNQSVSTEATTSLSSQLSESTRESEVLLENEERRLVKAKALLQELHVRLEEPKVHLMIRERKMKQLEELIETLDGEIHELALLMRPQLRVPDENKRPAMAVRSTDTHCLTGVPTLEARHSQPFVAVDQDWVSIRPILGAPSTGPVPPRARASWRSESVSDRRHVLFTCPFERNRRD